MRASIPWNGRRGILKGLQPNRHEHKAIFVTIIQNDINRYTIRKSRSVISLHPIVHRYTMLNRWNFVDSTRLCKIVRTVTIMRNNMDIVCRHTTFIIANPRADTSFDCTKQSSSVRMCQQMWKENYTAVAIRIIIKYMAEISPLHEVYVNVTSGKTFTIRKTVL
jgi:hypothetical protein